MRQIFLDTETTGLDAHNGDRIIEIGITSAFLADKPKFEAEVDNFLTYVADAEIVIHNAPFDVSFLNAELALAGRKPFKAHVTSVVDTLVMAKELFPGKRNSLDALCSRLEVDNSGRALHGALLDAELLADVYINMTRGQDALLMDTGETEEVGLVVEAVDLRSFQLPVIAANEQELQAHDEVLKQLDKSSGGKSLWQKLV